MGLFGDPPLSLIGENPTPIKLVRSELLVTYAEDWWYNPLGHFRNQDFHRTILEIMYCTLLDPRTAQRKNDIERKIDSYKYIYIWSMLVSYQL